MKKLSIFFLLSFTVVCGCLAQSVDEKAVAAALETLRANLLRPDKAALEGLASDDLTYGHSTALIEDKAAFVDDLVSGKSKFTRLDITNQTIHVTGDIALVRHQFNADVNGNTVNLGVLLVWRKEHGSWKLLARQAFKL